MSDLRLLTYLAPSIPADFFRAVAEEVARAAGVAVAVDFETEISGPLDGDEDPFASGRADVAFVCAPSFRWMRERARLLPLPVPLDPRANGRPVYFADVVARHPLSFDELRGKTWAYNDPNSRSGWFSMVERLASIGETPHAFFGTLVQAGSHLRALELVRAGVAAAAAIDSNALRLAGAGALHVIESWGPFPIQPLIARTSLAEETRARIEAALLAIPPEVLAPFGFARFTLGDPGDYTHGSSRA